MSDNSILCVYGLLMTSSLYNWYLFYWQIYLGERRLEVRGWLYLLTSNFQSLISTH